MIREWLIGTEVEGSSRGLIIIIIIPAFPGVRTKNTKYQPG